MALYQKTKRLISLIIALVLVSFLFYYSYSLFMVLAYPIKYKKQVLRAAKQHDVDKYLLLAIIREESRFNNKSVSDKGAVGLMQLMPKTAGWISSKRSIKFDKNKLADPEYNIDHGSWYFSYLHKRYKKTDLALAAYNGGPAIVDYFIKIKPGQNIKGSVYKETRNFIIRVNKSRNIYKKLYPDLRN